MMKQQTTNISILAIQEIDQINAICQELGLSHHDCHLDEFLDLKLYQIKLNV